MNGSQSSSTGRSHDSDDQVGGQQDREGNKEAVGDGFGTCRAIECALESGTDVSFSASQQS
jgi:hypothetical protein